MRMSIAITGAVCAAAVSTAAVGAKPTTRNRAEIPAEYRWDFSPIYSDWAAWEEGMKELDTHIDAFAALRGSLAQGPAQLLKAYQAYDNIGKLLYRISRYPSLQRDVDMRDQAVAGRVQRVGAVFGPVRDRLGLVHARAAQNPRSDGDRLDRADARRSRRTGSRSSTPTVSRRMCSTTRASGCSRWRAGSTTRRRRRTRS